jgi:hypothetical protein
VRAFSGSLRRHDANLIPTSPLVIPPAHGTRIAPSPHVLAFALVNLLVVCSLFVAMMALQRFGRRLGERYRRLGRDKGGTSPAEGAVYGLLSLFMAFTFSGAGTRFEARRHLVVQEANAIGTAWLRLDVLPTEAQPHLRDLFRQYVDARLDRYRELHDRTAGESARLRALALQDKIWSASIVAANASGKTHPFTVLLPALNEMIDITTTREEAMQLHPPPAVFLMIGVLTLIASVFAGYGMAGKTRSWIHTVAFAAVLSMSLFVIVDYEFPRLGLIRVDAVDSVLADVRRSMH